MSALHFPTIFPFSFIKHEYESNEAETFDNTNIKITSSRPVYNPTTS